MISKITVAEQSAKWLLKLGFVLEILEFLSSSDVTTLSALWLCQPCEAG